MKKRDVVAIILAGVLAVSASVLALAQNAAPTPEGAPAAPPRPGLVILDFKPAMAPPP